MVEFLQNLSNSDIFVTLVGVLVANFGTILGVIIYAVKQGLKNAASKEAYQKECKKYVEEAKQTALETISKVESLVNSLEFKITNKLDATEVAKKAEIEAQKIEITKTIQESKALLSLDDVLKQ